MKEKKLKPVLLPEKQENQTTSLIERAIDKGLPVEQMEKLFALHERQQANFAKAEYVRALASFQQACPEIKKTKKVLNKDGSLRYSFAPLDGIIEQIKKSLADNGLSYKWETDNKEESGLKLIKVTAIITHIAGHCENSSFEIPINTEGFMTTPQKYASSLTFAKRYSLINALGISTADEDTDATDVNDVKNAKSNRSKIVFLLKELGISTFGWVKEDFEVKIKELVGLDLNEKNFAEISDRLEVLVSEKNDDNSKI